MKRLERSAQCPLSLEFDLSAHESYILNWILRDHSNRTHDLRVRAGEPDTIRDVFEGIDALPAVTHLKLSLWGGGTYNFEERLQRQIAPNLRSLSLDKVGFHAWDLVSNLTTLTLQGSSAIASPSSFRDILSVLSRSPRLITLHWNEYWNHDLVELSNLKVLPFPPIRLMCLSLLDVVASLEWMELILDTLQMPPMVTLSLLVRDSPDGESIKHLLVSIRRHLHRPGGPVFRSVAIEHSAGQCLQFSAHTASFCPAWLSQSLQDSPVQFSLLTYAENQPEIRSSIRKIIHGLPFDSSSVNLNLRMPTDFTLETWRTIGMVLPQLKEIQIGMGHEMVAMLKGFVSTLKQGTRGLHGRRERRLGRQMALRPSKLSLNFLSWRRYPDPEAPARPQRFSWFNSLLHALECYRDLETDNKSAGEKWEALEFERHQGSEEYEMIELYRDRLFEVTGTLTIDGQVYDPVVWQEMILKAQRHRRELIAQMEAEHPGSTAGMEMGETEDA